VLIVSVGRLGGQDTQLIELVVPAIVGVRLPKTGRASHDCNMFMEVPCRSML